METGFMNKIIGLVIALVLGGLLVGGLLIPSIEAIQTNVGDEITITNNSPIVLREAHEGDVLKVVRSVSDGTTTDTWTLNGEVCLGPTGSADTWNVGVMSDGIYFSINSPSNGSIGSWIDIPNNGTLTNISGVIGGVAQSYQITFNADTMVLENVTSTPTTVATSPYSWAYVLCPFGEGEYCAAMPNGAGVVKDPNQIILSGLYYTGDLDTTYCYNKVAFVGNTDYSMTANITTALHEGTTDIYDANVTVTITDGTNSETFTPYRILVPYEVTGHETSGMYYVMFGVISILGIVALVVVAANAIRNKY